MIDLIIGGMKFATAALSMVPTLVILAIVVILLAIAVILALVYCSFLLLSGTLAIFKPGTGMTIYGRILKILVLACCLFLPYNPLIYNPNMVDATLSNVAKSYQARKADLAKKARQEKAAAEEKARQEKAAAEEKIRQEKAAAEEKARQEKAAPEEKARREKAAAELAERRAKMPTFSFAGFTLADTPGQVMQKGLANYKITTSFPVQQEGKIITVVTSRHDLGEIDLPTDKSIDEFFSYHNRSGGRYTYNLGVADVIRASGLRIDFISLEEKDDNTRIEYYYYMLPGGVPKALYLHVSGNIVEYVPSVYREQYGEHEGISTWVWVSNKETAISDTRFYMFSKTAYDELGKYVAVARAAIQAEEEAKRKVEEEAKRITEEEKRNAESAKRKAAEEKRKAAEEAEAAKRKTVEEAYKRKIRGLP